MLPDSVIDDLFPYASLTKVCIVYAAGDVLGVGAEGLDPYSRDQGVQSPGHDRQSLGSVYMHARIDTGGVVRRQPLNRKVEGSNPCCGRLVG